MEGRQNEILVMFCYGDVVLFTKSGIKYNSLNYFETFYATILVVHVAVKCSFLLVSYCKPKIKVKFSLKLYVFEDSGLCAEYHLFISFSCDISISFQVVVNPTAGIIAPK